VALDELADRGADPGTDRGRQQQRRREQAENESAGGAECGAAADRRCDAVLADGDLAAGVAAGDHRADHREVLGTLGILECLEVRFGRRGVVIRRDVERQIVVLHGVFSFRENHERGRKPAF
jgi:hypothetical protein